jgi:hypothetical protein
MQTLYRTVALKSTYIFVNTAFTYCVHAYARPLTSKLASLATKQYSSFQYGAFSSMTF